MSEIFLSVSVRLQTTCSSLFFSHRNRSRALSLVWGLCVVVQWCAKVLNRTYKGGKTGAADRVVCVPVGWLASRLQGHWVYPCCPRVPPQGPPPPPPLPLPPIAPIYTLLLALRRRRRRLSGLILCVIHAHSPSFTPIPSANNNPKKRKKKKTKIP